MDKLYTCTYTSLCKVYSKVGSRPFPSTNLAHFGLFFKEWLSGGAAKKKKKKKKKEVKDNTKQNLLILCSVVVRISVRGCLSVELN